MTATSPLRAGASGARLKTGIGGIVLVLLLAGGLILILSPAVRRPVRRVLQAMASGLEAERDDDLVLRIASLSGLSSGLPAYQVDPSGEGRAIAHVVAYGKDAEGAWVRLRFAPGEPVGTNPAGASPRSPDASRAGPGWELEAYPPDRSLGAALRVGLSEEGSRRFGAEIATRLARLWNEALMPEVEARLPAFLERIDPAGDTEARTLFQGLSKSALERLDPLLDELAAHVTSAIKAKFDMLERVGLLWKVVKGDAAGLQKEVMPVARAATQAWWAGNEDRVLTALGETFQEKRGALQAWAGGELFDAARRELVEPVLHAQRKRLEREGEALLRLAADEFVRAPSGGFRVRFTTLLRTQLLRKDAALLILRRRGSAR